jgi:hypothetical protein
MSNVERDLEAVWKEIKKWPVTTLAELCIRIANTIHTKRERQKLSRDKKKHAK